MLELVVNIIPALELTGGRATETYCKNNRVVVKYEFCSAPLRVQAVRKPDAAARLAAADNQGHAVQ